MLECDCAELGGSEGFERAVERTHRGTGSGDNNDFVGLDSDEHASSTSRKDIPWLL